MNEIVYHELINGVEVWFLRLADSLPQSNKRLMRSFYHSAVHQILISLDLSPQIGHRDSGQPYLVNHPLLFISISHRNKYVGIALSEQEVGIDVECFNPNLEKAKEYYLNREERLLSLEKDDLLLIWCAKEALYKQLGGVGIRPEFDFSFQVIDDERYLLYKEQSYLINSRDFGEMKLVWI